MSLRDFSDRAGRQWRVWDVTSDVIHPATRGEDYMRDYLDGWLAFESADGLAKCRLTPIPKGWADAAVEQLEEWLHAADTVRGERGSGAFSRASAEVASNPLTAANPRGPVRTFRFPGGRFWTVTEVSVSGDAPERDPDATTKSHILRFMSGSRWLDMKTWPRDWASLSDQALATLLTESFPRHSDPHDAGSQHRRSSDAEKR